MAFGSLPGAGLACVTFAKPKSSSFACPRPVTKMFAGLISRWMIPAACAASSASAISIPSEKMVSGLHWPLADAVLQCHAVEVLHDDEGLRAVLADFVNGADVGVVQS